MFAGPGNFLKLIEGSYTYAVLSTFAEIFSRLWLYALAGVIVTAFLSMFLSRRKLSAVLQKRGGFSILAASLAAVVSPLPTYTVIPLVAALFALGVPAAPLMAFLVASPLMNPTLFSITAGAMGLSMACARLLSGVILGMITGFVVRFFELSRHRHLSFSVPAGAFLREEANGGSGGWFTAETGTRKNVRMFLNQMVRIGGFTGKYLFLALIVASLVKVFFPVDWVTRLLGRHQSWAVFIAAGCGIPLYICGGASIPVINILVEMGMDKGAALAFFIAGPATKLPTVLTMNAVFKKRILLLYLIMTIGGAVILGSLYRLW